MSKQAEIAFGQAGIEADFLASLFETSDQILIKKLSNNDRLWSHQKEDSEGQPIPGKRKNNQAGVYIPHEERDSGFFAAANCVLHRVKLCIQYDNGHAVDDVRFYRRRRG